MISLKILYWMDNENMFNADVNLFLPIQNIGILFKNIEEILEKRYGVITNWKIVKWYE